MNDLQQEVGEGSAKCTYLMSENNCHTDRVLPEKLFSTAGMNNAILTTK